MATRIGVAEIVLALRTGQFNKAADQVKERTRSMAGNFDKLAVMAAKAGAAFLAIRTAGRTAKAIFDLGASVEETGSKFRAVFGAEAGPVERAISSFANLAGMSQTAAKDITATTGAIVQGMGISGRAASEFSLDVVRLAADLSSFNNIPIAETARAIQAAVTGEREQLKRLGIVIREVDVQQRALAMSGKESAKELTNQEKALATLQLVTERAGVAVGDLARTQNSAANKARELQGVFDDIKEFWAAAFLPILAGVLTKFREFVGGIQLMGIEAAESFARFKLFWAKTFGDDEAFRVALNNMHNVTEAARALKLAMFGVTEGAVGSTTGSGTSGATGGMRKLVVTARHLADTGLVLRPIVVSVAEGIEAIAIASGRAADEQNRLSDAMNKVGAVGRAFGFIGRWLGPIATVASGFSTFGTALAVGQGLQTAFSGGGTQSLVAGPPPQNLTVNLRVQGISPEATQQIRTTAADLARRDVPLII